MILINDIDGFLVAKEKRSWMKSLKYFLGKKVQKVENISYS